MEKRPLGRVTAIAICVLFAWCSGAWAGIEPSPWKPEINQLNAVQNNLDSIQERLSRVLAAPPDPWTPSVEGLVGRLSAMENKLALLVNMVTSVMDEVLVVPPDPWVTADGLVPALEGVRVASQGIADSIAPYLTPPPDPWIIALENVRTAAQNIADTAEDYLIMIRGTTSS